MSRWIYFIVVIVISGCLFLGGWNQALAETNEKPIRVLINNFQATGIEKDDTLDGAGHEWLGTSLDHADSWDSRVELDIVATKEEINKILERIALSEDLSPTLDKVVRTKLKDEGVDYVVFAVYSFPDLPKKTRIRVDASMVKVEELATSIKAHHTYKNGDEDPFPPLADDLVNRLADILYPGSKKPEPDSTNRKLFFAGFHWYDRCDLKEICSGASSHLFDHLIARFEDFEKTELRYDENEADTGRTCEELLSYHKDVNYFITGKVIVIKYGEKEVTVVSVAFRNKKCFALAHPTENCGSPVELITQLDTVSKLVNDIRSGFENEIKENKE